MLIQPEPLIATPDCDIENGRYVLQAATRVLPIYEETFDIAYPLPKLDTLVVSQTSNLNNPVEDELIRTLYRSTITQVSTYINGSVYG